LDASRWLGFIVTHADKDHLNLISSIIEYSGLLGTGRIGVLFGGKETMYKGEGEDLLNFLKAHGVPYYFASAVYELEANTLERPGLFYVPQSGCPADMILRHWEGTRNVRVISIDATPVSGRRRVKEDSNATSIVLRMQCGGTSFMLTGDKTVRESHFIVEKFEGYEGLLESDILLATHHGSSDDFSEKWAKAVNSRHVIFSAGRASFLHPRSDAVIGYRYTRRLEPSGWHRLQFYGVGIDDPDHRFRSVAIEEHSGDKAEGYTHAITNHAIFSTATQGSITYRVSDGAYAFEPTVPLVLTPQEVLYPFFDAPQLLDGLPINLQTIHLDGIRFPDGTSTNIDGLLPMFKRIISLTSLGLNDCEIRDEHVELLCDFIRERINIKALNLGGAIFTAASNKSLRDAWDSRGLVLPLPSDVSAALSAPS